MPLVGGVDQRLCRWPTSKGEWCILCCRGWGMGGAVGHGRGCQAWEGLSGMGGAVRHGRGCLVWEGLSGMGGAVQHGRGCRVWEGLLDMGGLEDLAGCLAQYLLLPFH